MTEPHIEVRMARGYVPISAELLPDLAGFAEAVNKALTEPPGPPRPRLPEPGPNPHHDALLIAADAAVPVFVELVKLHKPRGISHWKADGPPYIEWVCEGDEYGGYDAEPPEWPCETTAILATHLGVDLK